MRTSQAGCSSTAVWWTPQWRFSTRQDTWRPKCWHPTNANHQSVFLTPPWPEIYVNDVERQHGLAEAVAEYDRLIIAYRELGYETVVLPKVGVTDRAGSILSQTFPRRWC